ncbi:MAG: hypothetical protein II453_13115 [Alphaproteobacteria bacterium]|nr:hypothetical protein [Alphaproteobacteria bacterium]
MDTTYNPDWRYANMTRTEIEKHVKARCKRLTSYRHTIPAISGRKIRFYVTESDIEHLISDALYRAKGAFFINDICSLANYFSTAKYVKTEKEEKKGERAVYFYYYEIHVNDRTLYLNIKENKQRHRTTLYSITAQIKMPTL